MAQGEQNGVQLAQVAPNSLAAAVAAPKRGDSAEVTIARVAQAAGVTTCRPVSEQVTRFLVGKAPSSAMVFVSPNNANASLFSNSIEIGGADAVSYASAHYAPTSQNTCGFVYDAVTYWKESCASLANKLKKELKPLGPLGSKLAVFDGGPAMRMFLMPAGAGCVQIKKEILY